LKDAFAVCLKSKFTMGDFTIRTRKFKQNPLLGRKQFVLNVIHPGMANVSKKDLATKLASMYKVHDSGCIMLFGFKTSFGGGRSSGFGKDKMKKFEPRYRLKRAGLGGDKSGNGRRGKKDTKNRMKKTRGKEKTKAASGGKKK
jgi:small subunit ribosomal protein S24e